MKRNILLACALVALAGAGPTYAHHSYAMFDQEKDVTLEGTVTKFEFINPHSWLHVSVVGKGGAAEEWVLELGSPGQLARRGWKRNSLKPGDKLVMKIHPLKDGARGGAFRSAVTAAGEAVPVQASGG